MGLMRSAMGLKAVSSSLITGFTVATLGLFSPWGSAQETYISNFNPAPALEDMTGYEHKLTQEQFDLLLSIIQRPQNSDILARCDAALATDLPPEWHRWIYLKRVQIYTYDSREDLAIKAAERWLKENPNNRVNLGLECVLLQICASRESPAFHPTLEDLRRLGDPIFNADKYGQISVDVIDAHCIYAEGLHRFYWTADKEGRTKDIQLLKDGRDHLVEAKTSVSRVASKEVAAADSRLTASYIERKRREIDQKLKDFEAQIAGQAAELTVDQLKRMADEARQKR